MKETKVYHEVTQLLRNFFLQKNYVEVPTQSRLSILAACENPFSIATFEYNGEVWPLPQTGQMWLEYELLKNPEWEGCFCISTSYRDEKDPIPGRHVKIFPMFEFEAKGSFQDLIDLTKELCEYLGFGKGVDAIYDDICKEYGDIDTIEDEHESRMWEELGSTIFLTKFPERTSPFWNMKYNGDGTFNKADVILFGQETIGSAERSCDPAEMKSIFYSIMEEAYSKKLFELFGKERVEKELEDFLKFDFFQRFGGGIGLTRLARAWELNKDLALS
jgi:aspartyl/asparaginyl-tRNA synthetase